ncbi:hypothetical protein LTR22_027050 [Elasticomyces elasticus]|nr:hypothetical protein LTR22_027050 [Elasticomyces elasticus]
MSNPTSSLPRLWKPSNDNPNPDWSHLTPEECRQICSNFRSWDSDLRRWINIPLNEAAHAVLSPENVAEHYYILSATMVYRLVKMGYINVRILTPPSMVGDLTYATTEVSKALIQEARKVIAENPNE